MLEAMTEARIGKMMIFGGGLVALLGTALWGVMAHVAAIGFFTCGTGFAVIGKSLPRNETVIRQIRVVLASLASFTAGIIVLLARITGY